MDPFRLPDAPGHNSAGANGLAAIPYPRAGRDPAGAGTGEIGSGRSL